MRVSEFVAQARDAISMGWAKGSFRSAGSVCGISALERVAMHNLHNGGPQTFPKAKKAVLEKLAEFDPTATSIPHFNDASSTTKQDMLDLLDKTVIGLEEKGL